MSQFFDQASLVMVPSGYKDGKLYSQKPLSSSGELTFSRGSDIEATRVASNGYIQKAAVNLLLQSNTFSTSWVNSNSTETSGQSGYDGSSDAWQLTANTAGAAYLQQTNTNSGVQTFSVYAKAGTADHLQVYITGTDSSHYFDLTNGTASTATGTGAVDSSIQDIGSGWYRCSCVCNGTNATLRLYIRQGIGVDPSAGEYIYIQDAQLNYGLVAQEYQETTTTSVVAGITNDLPRLDYSGGASCPSLKLEPSRSNVLPHSEFFGASDWVKINTSVTTNATTSPEGVVNASSLTEDTSSGFHVMYDNIVAAFSTAHTLSAFVKPNGRNIIYLRMENASTGSGLGITYFNISTGQILTDSSTSSSIEAYANGWYRVTITATTPSANSTLFAIGLADADNSRSYTGDGTSGIYLYGAQAEPSASYPSSMIPTYGTSASRTAETALKTGISSLIGQTEGTAFVEFEINRTPSSTDRVLILSDGTSSERIGISIGATGLLYAFVVDGGVTQAEIVRSSTTAGTYKAAFAYKANDFVFYVNGVQVGTDTAGTIPSCSRFDLGQQLGSNELGGSVKQALLFKTRLSNADLATLTA